MGCFEHCDNIARLLRFDRKGLAEQEVVGKVAVKAPTLIGRRSDLRGDDAVLAVVAADGQVDRCFGMVGVVFKMASSGDHSVSAERPVVALDGRCCSLDVELGAPNGADVTLAESGLTAVSPLHPQRQLVDVRRVVPHPGVGGAQDSTRCAAVELVDPVDMV
jgi:hypothetical protein